MTTRPPLPVLLLYGFTIFLSSFLLFLIEPVFAKLILPWFGGTAAVWTTCLVFFQVALLAGYFYAFVLVRAWNPRRQAILHVLLLAAALFLLPVIPGPHWRPTSPDAPALRLLLLLTAILGLPFFLLSTTSPLLQAWFSGRWPGSRPYRMFALSNAGALLALGAYPILIEPRWPTRTQDLFWSAAFVGFAVLCGITAWVTVRSGQRAEPIDTAASPPPRSQLIQWFALSTGGSMLLLATTNQLTQNVAAVPFLWLPPLAIYLVSFILCFESSRWYRRGLYLRLLAMALAAVAYTIYDIEFSDAIVIAIPVFLLGLFIGCMYCHGELSERKPAQEHLTSFYMMIALGGATGAVFVGLLAPVVFSGIYELPVSLLFVAALALWLNWEGGWSQRMLWAVVTLAMAVVLAVQVQAYHLNALVLTRNFYGALRVTQFAHERSLYHGTIRHGSEFLSPQRRMSPTTYYGPLSGVGLTLRYCCQGPKRVGAVGLGTGTIAAYGAPGDEFRFYEINPSVVELARSQFFYLGSTPAKTGVVLGDARLSLENEPAQAFDVLVLDAFSGDAIPVHLLTREAFAVYLRHLKPDGILAVHVSNQYLDLAPVVSGIASYYGYRAVVIHNDKVDLETISSATWVLMTRNHEFLDRPEIASAAKDIRSRPDLRLWTDDYNNLLQVVRWAPDQ